MYLSMSILCRQVLMTLATRGQLSRRTYEETGVMTQHNNNVPYNFVRQKFVIFNADKY